MEKRAPRLKFAEEGPERSAAAAERSGPEGDKPHQPASLKQTKLRHKENKGSQRQAQLRFGKKIIQEDGNGAAKRQVRRKAESAARADAAGGQKRPVSVQEPPAQRPVLTETDDSAQFTRTAPKAQGTQVDAVKSTVNKPAASASAGEGAASEKGASAARKQPKGWQSRAAHPKSRLKSDSSGKTAPSRKAQHVSAHALGGVAAGQLHHQVSQRNEDGNVGVQSALWGEALAEGAARTVSHVRYSQKLRAYDKAAKLDREAGQASTQAMHRQRTAEQTEASSNPLSRWRQRQALKREYAAARTGRGAVRDAGSSAKTAQSAGNQAEELLNSIRSFFDGKKRGFKIFLVLGLILALLVTQLQSCGTLLSGALTTIAVTSWPADDVEISKADVYYTKLEAQLQKEINQIAASHPGCDEYHYNVAEIGHDPTMLISYLSSKYGAFTFQSVKSELDALFAHHYDLTVETANETRTVTKTVQAGDYIGEVVTSGYCSCSICCGKWSGGPTASGVYPSAEHTIAVDASNPIVPMGTEIIMNGKLYKVEDTGNFDRYGVDFDVYYDDHDAALSHGHQTWEAYYAGGDGEEIEVTTTETVKVCYVTLTAADFEGLLTSRLTDEEKILYDLYMETRGNRVFFGTPLACDWRLSIAGNYGWRCDGNRIVASDCLDLSAPAGMEVLSVMDGIVQYASGGTVILSDGKSFQVTLSGCDSIMVSAGDAVEIGQKIAEVGSSGLLEISLTYQGEHLNPYFYLDVGEGAVYGDAGDATGKAALLIAKAKQYLGVPYVWGGYSPSGFDCSGFVSYAVNNCGAGFDFGRLTAEGWRQKCTTISPSQARPGDLIFFQGTYNTSGASHIGIYLGNGQMIHAGDPVQISSVNTSYWQQHFLCYGRIPGM